MKSFGKIIYSPKTHLSSSERWAIVACDDEISKYYRHLYLREFPYKTKLVRPIFGAHISFIRNEQIKNFSWGLNNNKIVEFDYDGGVLDNEEYFWLRVKCDFLKKIRVQYGLSPYPEVNFHLTIGRTA